ncbi:MAG: hypothetical protein ACR2H6_06830 [Pyrinomonadaceae bacterium]
MTKTNLVIVLALSTILGTTALAFNLVSSRVGGDEEKRPVEAVATEDPPGSSASANQNIEVEVITATAAGFEPATITRPRGPFILALHNRSGERELALRLFRVSGEQVQEVRLRNGRRTQHQQLDLPAGEYLISEVGHSEWRCQLVINR